MHKYLKEAGSIARLFLGPDVDMCPKGEPNMAAMQTVEAEDAGSSCKAGEGPDVQGPKSCGFSDFA